MAPEKDKRSVYVPGFKDDIFISYAHRDDWEDWVKDLYTYLCGQIRYLLKTDDVRIWMDPNVDRADAYWDVLEEAIAGSAVFVSILSPDYATSRSCSREVRRFRDAVSKRGGLKVGARYRLMRVIKTP